jgi:pimeloyl-ACP methyl ester carboxylesterase
LEYQINYRNHILNYSILGNGPKVALAFHGFGQSNHVYQPLSEVLSDEYTIYSFDLFFHGKSAWNDLPVPISKSFLTSIIGVLIKEKGFDGITLIGFSIGCKYVITLTDSLREVVDKIILIAPDGLYANPWYSFFTSFWLTRMVFKYTIDHPKLFFSITGFMKKTNIVDKKLLKFAETQMDSREKRLRVYNSWVGFRNLNVSPSVLTDIINTKEIELEIYLASLDRVIEEKHLQKFLKATKNYKLEVLNSNHNTMITKVATHLKLERSKDNGFR